MPSEEGLTQSDGKSCAVAILAVTCLAPYVYSLREDGGPKVSKPEEAGDQGVAGDKEISVL